jgi:hypothetical protein
MPCHSGLLAAGMSIFLVLGMCAGILYFATGQPLILLLIVLGIITYVPVLTLWLPDAVFG